MKVTALILTHNRPFLLKRAIDSVLGQTFKDIECIVVDDASDVPSIDICEEAGVKYIYISPEESRGGNYARNVGIKASEGEYIAFLDDDDYWLPTKIERQIELMKTKDCEAVYGRMIWEKVGENGAVELEENPYPSSDSQGDLHKRILYEIPTTTSCLMISRSLLLEVGLFDESLRFWQEYELLIRLAQKSSMYMIEEPVIVYRIDKNDKGRLTNKYYEWKKAAKYVYRKHKLLYGKLSSNEKLRVKQMYCFDAKERALNCGSKWLHLTNAVKCSFLGRSIYIVERIKRVFIKDQDE